MEPKENAIMPSADRSLLPLALPHGAQWAIEESAASQLLQLLRSTDGAVHRAEFEARSGGSELDSLGVDVQSGVATIRMSGVLTKSPTSLSGGTSTVRMRRAVRAATSDDDVKSIVLVIDSPGGSVSGTSDLADDVAAACRKKPVYAFVEDCCCSAAYWIAAQCSAIYVNPTAMVGSIGTYMVIMDASRLYENAGVSVHVLSTGKYKGAGADGARISDEQLEGFQAMVDELNGHFLGAVARGRQMSREKLAALADGSVWIGEKAVANGLVDSVASVDQVVALARRAGGRPSGARAEVVTFCREDISPAGMTLADESDAALAAVAGLTARLSDLRQDRAAEGRPLSEKARTHLSSLAEALEASLSEARALLEDGREMVAEEPIAAPIRQNLARAALEAELALAIP